ncbi:flippase-like domain-containing protein [Flavobacteriaceae bacterium]|jgi:glycosyltransferase 2 family protein|nr:flippase-like domain-containing protein [Flavobacteriaceae bacterium]
MVLNRKALNATIPLLLAVFFGWYTFSKLPMEAIIPYFKNANYSYIFLGVVLGACSHLSRAYRWRFMLHPLGYHPKLMNSIMAVFIAYLANFGIPRSGEILRAVALANYEKVPFEKGFGTIVAERFADLIMILGVALIALFLEFNYISNLLLANFNIQLLMAVFAVSMILALLLLLILKNSNIKFVLKIKRMLSGLMDGVLSVFRMDESWPFIFHTIFIWTMYVLMFYVTSFAVPELNNISFGAILVAFISASFTIAATNGGIFVYPLAVGVAFSLFDIPETPSIAFGWIIWTAQTVMIIFLGSLSFLYLPIFNRKQ